jgi:alpha-tubulin suppressor-like RCC1 family protein
LWGSQNADTTDIPETVPAKNIGQQATQVVSSEKTTYVLLKDTSVVGWGDNTHWQLGQNEEAQMTTRRTSRGTNSHEITSIPGMTGVAAIYADGNYAVVVKSNNDVFVLGVAYAGTGADHAGALVYRSPKQIDKVALSYIETPAVVTSSSGFFISCNLNSSAFVGRNQTAADSTADYVVSQIYDGFAFSNGCATTDGFIAAKRGTTELWGDW